jgi:hypothetical protein
LRCQVQHHLNYEKFPGWPNARVKAFYDYLDPTGGSLCKLYPNIIGEWFIIYVNGYPYVAVVSYIFDVWGGVFSQQGIIGSILWRQYLVTRGFKKFWYLAIETFK